MKRYYNSIEWGIQEKETDDIRKKGLDFLKDIQCRTIKSYMFPLKQIIEDRQEIEKVFQRENKVFIICEPINPSYQRIGQMNITNAEQLYTILSKIPPSMYDKYKLYIMQQIETTKGCFTGTAMSDGKGKLLMEFLTDTVNSRELTSRGADAEKIESCFFSGFDTVEELPKTIPIKLIKAIKDKCHFFKGYFEFTYGSINGESDLYFTFYSDIPKYINALERYQVTTKDSIHSKARYLDYNEDLTNER